MDISYSGIDELNKKETRGSRIIHKKDKVILINGSLQVIYDGYKLTFLINQKKY